MEIRAGGKRSVGIAVRRKTPHITNVATATAIANVGPGLGDTIGPAGNFASLPDSAKLLLCSGMLLGRLELFAVLVLLTPGFWRG